MNTTSAPAMTPMAAAEQAAFRVLLDCMARPGKVAVIGKIQPVDGPWSAALQALQALLDHEVTFAVAADARAVREALLRRTGSRTAPIGEAAYVLADAASAADAVRIAREGDLEYPELGATVVIRCASLGQGGTTLTLTGPGIEGHRHVEVGGLGTDVFAAIRDRNSSFPLGIDVVLASEDGNVVSLPRTTHISLEGHGD